MFRVENDEQVSGSGLGCGYGCGGGSLYGSGYGSGIGSGMGFHDSCGFGNGYSSVGHPKTKGGHAE